MITGIRMWLTIGGAIAVVAVLFWSHSAIYRAGRMVEQSAMLERINKENRDAGSNAESWRSAYRKCVDSGGVFSFDLGTCDR